MFNFENNNKYTFDIYPRFYFDTDYQNVTVVGKVGHSIASKYMDIYAVHSSVFPTLPPGTINDPTVYDYLVVKTSSGQETVVAVPWIKQDTIRQIDAQTLIVTVQGVSTSDTEKLRLALIQNGFTQIAIRSAN